MDTSEIKKFLDVIKDTDIEELGWERDGVKISFTRASAMAAASAPSSKNGSDAKAQANGSHTVPDEPVSEKKPTLIVRSPMVGTFYRASTPDHPPFVVNGSTVSPGQKVAVIEAMKIMKDVTSNVEGKIIKILVENGHAVEYGQELFWVEPPDDDV